MTTTGSTWWLWGQPCYYGVYVVVMGSTLLLRGLRGCYGVNPGITGSTWLLWGQPCYYGVYVVVMGVNLAITGFTWLLWGQPCYYGVYVVVIMGSTLLLRGLRGCYGSTLLLRGLRGCYGVNPDITGSTWLLWGQSCYYGVYM